jgi:hypothetical protein
MTESRAQVIAAIGLLSKVADSDLFEAPRGTPATAGVQDQVLAAYLEPRQHRHWALLESVVAFDDVLYDSYAFGRHQMTGEMKARIEALREHGLTRTTWPLHAYDGAASRLRSWRNALRAKGLEEAARNVPANNAAEYSPTNDAFWDSAEKNYHDDLYQSPVARFSFANSDDSFERTFFYAELATGLGVSLLPRPSTTGSLLDTMGRSYARCAHQLVVDSLRDFDALMRPAEVSVVFPPLARKIAELSLRERRAPVDIAIELRNSEGAAAYRRHIADLQGELRQNSRPSNIKQLIGDFERTVEKWSQDLAPAEGVKYQTRNLRVQVLPAAAGILTWWATGDFKLGASVAGGSNVALQAILGNALVVRDPILWGGEKYVAFVADWYQP